MNSDTLYFLSYSRLDERIALRFADDLRAQGVNIWVDQYEIRPSQHWDRAIERAVQACRGLIVMLSPRSVISENVADEISFAIESGKKVIPILIEKCTVPLRVTRMHMLDATRDYDSALRECLAEMGRTDGRVEVSAPPRASIVDPQYSAEAERRLTPLVGPMAGRIVYQAALRAISGEDFMRMLSEYVPEGRPRQQFLSVLTPAAAAAPQPKTGEAAGISQDLAAELATLLTRFLGPIAPRLVRREVHNCDSLTDLHIRLSEIIPSKDRAEFLRQVRAVGT